VQTPHPSAAAPLVDAVTRRLTLRRLRDDDLEGLTTVFADPDVWSFELGRGLTRVETRTFLDRQQKLWADFGLGGCGVRERARPDLIGVVGLGVPTVAFELLPAVTVGWRLSSLMWGKGYATEAASALLDQAFTTMALDRVGCVTNAENLRSIRVVERLGMRHIEDALLPEDDGTRTVTASLFDIARDTWLVSRPGGRVAE
jgi:RimJ/RimL family protein N-acetyltransferase